MDAIYLYDCMYIDKPKVGSFLSQIMSAAMVTSETAAEVKGTRSKGVAEATFKIGQSLGFGIGGKASAEHEKASSVTKTITSNPEWLLAREFIDYVEDVENQSADIAVGQLRSFTGKLSILDFDTFRTIMDNDELISKASNVVKEFFGALREENKIKSMNPDTASIQASQTRTKRNLAKLIEDNSDKWHSLTIDGFVVLGQAMLQGVLSLPTGRMALLKTGCFDFWFTLPDQHLLHDHKDVVLKHGFELEGNWAVAGVVDGMPRDETTDLDVTRAIGTYKPGHWVEALGSIAGIAREYGGRPLGAHSMLPLVIYRRVDLPIAP